ncbi:HdeA family protein [Staphylococcus gallinarum]|uniref:HdeA family protein n=1 Tax=Staphylococcus gallinarum TaxID=1293 RepID=UPI001E4562F1|nr:HdeA family protein [Staphylococcus gallinarum]MCD8845203.1 HdeA family protein [Staphylococcus gallinarum]
MKDYVKWFCEDFLKMDFDNKELLSYWLTMKKDIANVQIGSISYNIKREEQQLTIFDI